MVNSTVLIQPQSFNYNLAPIYQDWSNETKLFPTKQNLSHNVLLVYFDAVFGPSLFLSIPNINEIDKKVINIGEKLLDLNFNDLGDDFSQFSINNVVSFNRHFLINSPNRGGTNSVLLCFIVKESNDSMKFKAHRFVEAVHRYSDRFVKAVQTEYDIYKGFLGCENRVSKTNSQNIRKSQFLEYSKIICKYEILNYYLRRFESNCVKYLIEQEIEPFNDKYYLLSNKNKF